MRGFKRSNKRFQLSVSYTGYISRCNKQPVFVEAGKREKQLQFSHEQHEDGAADKAVAEPYCDGDEGKLNMLVEVGK